MRSRRTQNPRIIAVLKLPEYEVPAFLVRARHIVDSMDGNPWFPDPEPPLATLRAAILALSQAETATYSQRDTTANRDVKREELNSLLKHACSYVQRIADKNPEHAGSIIESAAMYVKEPRALPGRIFSANDGDVSGTARVEIPVAGDRATYELQHSVDGMKSWIHHPGQGKSTFLVDGLTPGSTVWFRYRVSVKGMMGDWSDPISLIVR
jgi:hypothetical protein